MRIVFHRHLPACLAPAFVLVLTVLAHAQPVTAYRLDYSKPGALRVHVTITPPAPVDAPATLVIPRNYPGGYSRVPYDRFVEDVRATLADGGGPLSVTKGEYGPRWDLGKPGQRVGRVEYDVDLARMELELLEAVEASKVRPGYAGILGYSVFGYLDGLERGPVELMVVAPDGWPAITTLNPVVPAPRGTAAGRGPNFDVLADSQVLMGPDLQLRRLDGAIPLVLAVYAEADEDLALEGAIAREALDRVQQYFGDHPIRQYTVSLELLRPLEGHSYGFSQEHVDSGTFSLDTSRATTSRTTADQKQVTLLNYAHHMAHSWVPKRAYGVGYSPFTWEATPAIDTVWFNEGFGRYAAIQAIADGLPGAEGTAYRSRQLARLRGILDAAPPFIRRMPLLVLSREASYMYSEDFRFGMNVFARGSLMAAEMDERIRKATRGAKSLRDALRFLVARTERLAQPFEVDEFPDLVREGAGVDVRAIFERWLQPPDPGPPSRGIR